MLFERIKSFCRGNDLSIIHVQNRQDSSLFYAVHTISKELFIVKLFLANSQTLNWNELNWLYGTFNGGFFLDYLSWDNSYVKWISDNNADYYLIAYRLCNANPRPIENTDLGQLAQAMSIVHNVSCEKERYVNLNKFKKGRTLKFAQEVALELGNSTVMKSFETLNSIVGCNFLHGDFRTENILLDPIKLIDFEDCLWGPVEYDIGRFFQSLASVQEINHGYLYYDFLHEYQNYSKQNVCLDKVILFMIIRFSYRCIMEHVDDNNKISSFIKILKKII